MLACIEVFQSGFTNLEIVKLKVNSVRDEAVHIFKPSLFNNRKSEVFYYTMAVNQAMEIISSLEERFITGINHNKRNLPKVEELF